MIAISKLLNKIFNSKNTIEMYLHIQRFNKVYNTYINQFDLIIYADIYNGFSPYYEYDVISNIPYKLELEGNIKNGEKEYKKVKSKAD